MIKRFIGRMMQRIYRSYFAALLGGCALSMHCVPTKMGECTGPVCKKPLYQCSAGAGQENIDRAAELLSTEHEIYQKLVAAGTEYVEEYFFSFPGISRRILRFSQGTDNLQGTIAVSRQVCRSYSIIGESGGKCGEPCIHCEAPIAAETVSFAVSGNVISTTLNGSSVELLAIPGQSERMYLLPYSANPPTHPLGFLEKQSGD